MLPSAAIHVVILDAGSLNPSLEIKSGVIVASLVPVKSSICLLLLSLFPFTSKYRWITWYLVSGLGVHTAYNVTLPLFVVDNVWIPLCWSSYTLAHPEVVAQPLNVYQVLSNPLAFNVTLAVHLTLFIESVLPDVLVVPLNIILYTFSVTTGVAVTALAGIVNVVFLLLVLGAHTTFHPLHI